MIYRYSNLHQHVYKTITGQKWVFAMIGVVPFDQLTSLGVGGVEAGGMGAGGGGINFVSFSKYFQRNNWMSNCVVVLAYPYESHQTRLLRNVTIWNGVKPRARHSRLAPAHQERPESPNEGLRQVFVVVFVWRLSSAN